MKTIVNNKKSLKRRIVKGLCIIGGITVVATVIVLAFNLGALKEKFNQKKEDTDLFEAKQDVDITRYDVEREMSQIGQLSVASSKYEGYAKYETSVKKNIPFFGETEMIGTKCSVDIKYEGVVKAGYELEGINTKLDTVNKQIVVTLPEAKVLDSYIDDWYPTNEKDALFYDISTEEIRNFLEDDIEPAELKNAEECGIYQEAEESVKNQITNQLSCFSAYGYEVVFKTTTSVN